EPTQGDTFSAPPKSGSYPAGWFFNPAAVGTPTYQWLRCDNAGDLDSCVPIAGATASTYVATAADVNNTLAVQITGKNSQGSAAVLPLAGTTNPIIPLPASYTDPATPTTPAGSPPAIHGNAYVGSDLVGNVGTWSA